MAVIWLIEDNLDFSDAIQRSLKAHIPGNVILAFECCEDAIAAFTPQQPPDVILLDVGLPGMDGIEGIQKFKSLTPNVNILILTVFEDDDKIFRAICGGASGYLLKSESIKSVTASIEQAMAGGSPMNPRVARRVLEMFSKLTPLKKDYGLNERENEILELIVQGCVKKEIADKLNLNPHTVNYTIRRVYDKLQVHCQAEAVSLALKEGLIDK
jgi:DNA-binding NarL/FixJ family response regulator